MNKIKIRFLAFKGNSFISKLIKFWTRDEYSHIAYLSLDNQIIECWKFDFPLKIYWDFSSLKNHNKNTIIEIWSKEVDGNKAILLDNFMKSLAYKKVKYDWLGLFGFVIKCSDDKNRLFCSEGCAMGLVKSNIWPQLKTELIHPGYFVQLLKVSGFKKEKTIII